MATSSLTTISTETTATTTTKTTINTNNNFADDDFLSTQASNFITSSSSTNSLVVNNLNANSITKINEQEQSNLQNLNENSEYSPGASNNTNNINDENTYFNSADPNTFDNNLNSYDPKDNYENDYNLKNDHFDLESQTDLFKKIFEKSNKSIDFKICLKLEELINSNDLSLDEFDSDDNEKIFYQLINGLNEYCLQVFEEFLSNLKAKNTIKISDETVTDATDTTEASADSNKLVENGESVNVKKSSSVTILIETVQNWLNINNPNELAEIARQNENDDMNDKYPLTHMQRPGPDEQKLKEILERTGYSHDVSSGQRKYGGPPPNWQPVTLNQASSEENGGESTAQKETDQTADSATTSKPNDANSKQLLIPPVGCECFVGKLPRDLFEDELIVLFEKQGRIWDLRLMIDPNTGFNKGYCFVTYCEKESAKSAAKNLNDYEIRPGKTIRVNLSVANVRLFIGNIPKTKNKDELKKEFNNIVEGLSELVIFNPDSENDKFKNRGFCFLEFIDHKSASIAKRKLSSNRFNRVFNRELTVDWADQNEEPDEETMSKVKVLYVKNICSEITEQEVEKLFEQYGKLERIRKMKDYAFIHFEQREDAVKAMQELQAKTLGKTQIEISLARPLTDKKKQQSQQKRQDNNLGGNINSNKNNFNKKTGPYNDSGWNSNNNNNNNNNFSNFNNNNQRQMSNRGGGNRGGPSNFHNNRNSNNNFGNNAYNNGNQRFQQNSNYNNNNNNYQRGGFNNGNNLMNRNNNNLMKRNSNSPNTNFNNNRNNKRKIDNNESNFFKKPRFQQPNNNNNNNNNNYDYSYNNNDSYQMDQANNWNNNQMYQNQQSQQTYSQSPQQYQQNTNNFQAKNSSDNDVNNYNQQGDNEWCQDNFDSSQWI